MNKRQRKKLGCKSCVHCMVLPFPTTSKEHIAMLLMCKKKNWSITLKDPACKLFRRLKRGYTKLAGVDIWKEICNNYKVPNDDSNQIIISEDTFYKYWDKKDANMDWPK